MLAAMFIDGTTATAVLFDFLKIKWINTILTKNLNRNLKFNKRYASN